ncbi:hypothetical protein IY145_09260 [Methylosinus sp. H3A]|uniref:hypothetical protein n=1 Tax=Methylosinus sp. H3A TaxID=2785786 RepID=UPI0018C34B2D|nr:hypothetical protein [Methylosinus sp. H3A]MBG0809565.1 hypothetical protein [Methylosinus sp. H3A]
MTFAKLLAAAFAALSIAACNSTQPVVVAEAPSTRNTTPAGFNLPEGSGCAGVIARYRAVMDNDLAMGHVNQGVYATIEGEIGAAAAACSAGRDAQAVALVRASKARHGYPG